MNKKISLSILIVLSFVNNLIAQTNYTLLESNPCLYSLLKFKKNYAKDLKETKQNFEITEECSKIACNDSILIELLLADTLNLFSTARIKKKYKREY